jgi:hypothetical protein
MYLNVTKIQYLIFLPPKFILGKYTSSIQDDIQAITLLEYQDFLIFKEKVKGFLKTI